MKKNKAIIVDIDGTLADVNHRVHHVNKEEKEWKEFFDKMVDDDLNIWCAQIIAAMEKEGYKILFLTGRSNAYREHTENWLKYHRISYEKLFMRDVEDKRPDEVTKKEIYQKEIAGDYSILFVLDDRLSVVKMWREIGLVCLQCDWGDF